MIASVTLETCKNTSQTQHSSGVRSIPVLIEILPPPLVTCTKYIAAEAVDLTALDAIIFLCRVIRIDIQQSTLDSDSFAENWYD